VLNCSESVNNPCFVGIQHEFVKNKLWIWLSK